MIVTNKITGKDVTGLYLQYMEGKLTKEQFEEKAELPTKQL